jgi:predicted GTPase
MKKLKSYMILLLRQKSSPTVSKDLPKYIMDKDIVRAALRTAKDVDATDEEWQEFITRLERDVVVKFRRRKMRGLKFMASPSCWKQ